MYKKQMTLQRVLCILMIVTSAMVFIYALGFMTDVYDMIGPLREKDKTPEIQQFMTDMNQFDQSLVKMGIGMLLISLTLLLTNTHTRRKYYIGNYIATGLTVCAAITLSVWAHEQVIQLKERYLSGIIDFETVKSWADRRAGKSGVSVYTDSTFWFDIHYVIFGLLILFSVLLILNAIWKIKLMNSEKKALAMGKAVI